MLVLVNRTFYVFLLIFLCCFQTYALETMADEIFIDSNKNTYTLIGNAIAKQEGKTFKADLIVIYKSNKEELPEKIIATGNVYFEEEGTTITSNNCESDMKFVIFSKNVVLKNDEVGVINADKAKYDMATKKMDITSDKKVKLTLDKKREKEFSKKNKK